MGNLNDSGYIYQVKLKVNVFAKMQMIINPSNALL